MHPSYSHRSKLSIDTPSVSWTFSIYTLWDSQYIKCRYLIWIPSSLSWKFRQHFGDMSSDKCRSHIFDDIFNVANTVTGSQSWSRVGESPRRDICKASTKLVCRRWTSSSVTRGTVILPTHQQTSSWHVATSAMMTRHVSKNGGLLTGHDTDISN